MATNQELRQAAARTAGSSALDYNGDLMAMFDVAGIAAGNFNGRLLDWINLKLVTSYTSVETAMSAYAASKSVARWDDVTDFT